MLGVRTIQIGGTCNSTLAKAYAPTPSQAIDSSTKEMTQELDSTQRIFCLILEMESRGLEAVIARQTSIKNEIQTGDNA